MNILKRTMLVSAAIAAVFSSLQASAVNGLATPYAAGDLLLNFRTQGTDNVNDYTIDLGNVNTFLTAHQGTVSQISEFSTVQSALGNLNNVYWTAAATDGSLSSHLWLSSQSTGHDLWSNPGSYQLDRAGSLSQGAARNGITSVGNGTAFGLQLAPTVVTTPDSAAYSYKQFVTLNGAFSYDGAGSAMTAGNGYEALTGANFNGTSALDLYDLQAGSGKGAYQGFFDLKSDGSLNWVSASAVPEPTTAGLFGLFGLLAMAVRRSMKRNA